MILIAGSNLGERGQTMRKIISGSLFALVVGAGLLGGAPAQAQEIRIQIAPPAPRVEVVGMAPSPQHFWIGGHWRWEGGKHVWTPGHWEGRRAGQIWEPAHWAHWGHHWRFVPGHWRPV